MSQTKRPRLSGLTQAELLARAEEYRRMAATGSLPDIQDALLNLGSRLEEMAAAQEGGNARDTKP